MNTETIYLQLKDLTNNFKSSTVDYSKLMHLKNELEIEIQASNNKQFTSKERIKKIDTYFNKLKNGRRPVFGYYTTSVEGYKSFTDSYFLVELKDEDFNGLTLQDVAETKYNYPALDRVTWFSGMDSMELSVTFNVNDILKKMKLLKKKDDVIKVINNKGYETIFGVEVLKMFIISMNLKNSDTITLKAKSDYYPFHYVKENGSRGIILPCHP